MTLKSKLTWDEMVAAVYDCALESSNWNDLIGAISTATGAKAGVLHSLNYTSRSGKVLVQHNTDPDWQIAYARHYATINPSIQAKDRIKVLEPFTFSEIFGWKAFAATPFHNEYRAPQGFGDSLSLVLEKSKRGNTSISIFRPHTRPFFSDADVDLLRRLTPHITRSLKIGNLLGQLHGEHAAMSAFLDRLTFAVVALDADGRLLFLNAPADEHLEQRLIRLAADNTLGFASAEDTAWLGDILRRRPGTLPKHLVQPNDGPPLVLTAIAFSDGDGGHIFRAIGEVACLLVIQASDLPAVDAGPLLASLHGLTRAETQVLLALLDGLAPEKIADRLAISTATVRTHLHHIFAKTGTARQSDLMRAAAGLQLPITNQSRRPRRRP